MNVIALERVRRHARVECDSRARVVGGGRAVEGWAHNLSLGGVWIDRLAFPVGTSVEVTLWLEALGPVHAQGTVRRCTAEGMGVQFHLLEPVDLVRLHRFVSQGLGTLDAA